VKRELFALGSAIYEIMAWERPFQELEDDEVELRYAREEFPSLRGNIAGPVIKKCWNEEFESAEEVLESLTHCNKAAPASDLARPQVDLLKETKQDSVSCIQCT
jgi:hypothetical protein